MTETATTGLKNTAPHAVGNGFNVVFITIGLEFNLNAPGAVSLLAVSKGQFDLFISSLASDSSGARLLI